MDDLLLETLKDQGGNSGVDGMLKPGDMERIEHEGRNVEEAQARIAAEEAERKKKEAAGGGEGGEGAKGGEGAPAGQIDLVELEKKILAGTPLSAEEAQFAAKIDDKLKEATPEVEKFTIDGKELTPDEVEAQMRKDWKLGELKISDEGLKQMRTDYVNQRNKDAANSHINRGYNENARQKEENARLTEQNLMEKARLEAERNRIIRDHKEAAEEIKQLKILAASPITIKDAYENVKDADGNVLRQEVNPEKMEQYNEKVSAQRELKRLEARQLSLQNEVETNSEQQLQNEISGFITAHAEYNTSEPLKNVADKMKAGQPVNPDDKRIMIEIYSLLNDRANMRLPLEEIYDYRKSQNTLSVKPKAQPGTNGSGAPKLPDIPTNSQLFSEKVRLLREKQKKAPASIGGGGQGDRGPAAGEKRESLKLIEEERAAKGIKSEKFLQDLGYK